MRDLPYVDTAVRNEKRIPLDEIRLLQHQHNVNLHSDSDGFEDADVDDEFEGLSIVSAEELFCTHD